MPSGDNKKDLVMDEHANSDKTKKNTVCCYDHNWASEASPTLHCKKWGVTVHLCHGVLGHFHVCWCNVTLQGVLVHNGVFHFHNTFKKCSKVF